MLRVGDTQTWINPEHIEFISQTPEHGALVALASGTKITLRVDAIDLVNAIEKEKRKAFSMLFNSQSNEELAG